MEYCDLVSLLWVGNHVKATKMLKRHPHGGVKKALLPWATNWKDAK